MIKLDNIKRCVKCFSYKSIDHFYLYKSNKENEYSSNCNECFNKYKEYEYSSDKYTTVYQYEPNNYPNNYNNNNNINNDVKKSPKTKKNRYIYNIEYDKLGYFILLNEDNFVNREITLIINPVETFSINNLQTYKYIYRYKLKHDMRYVIPNLIITGELLFKCCVKCNIKKELNSFSAIINNNSNLCYYKYKICNDCDDEYYRKKDEYNNNKSDNIKSNTKNNINNMNNIEIISKFDLNEDIV